MKNTGNTNKLLEQGVVHLTALFLFFSQTRALY